MFARRWECLLSYDDLVGRVVDQVEALGAIEGDSAEMERCYALMREFSDPEKEANQCVRESCEVALDAADYWRAYSA